MSLPASAMVANTLLKKLSEADHTLMSPHLTPVRLERGSVLCASNEPITDVYFLQNGVASITAVSLDGERTEVGVFGRDGMSATCVLLGVDRSPNDNFVQVGPADALRMPVAKFREGIARSPTLHRSLLLYVQTLMVQTTQCVVANARHSMEGRLARWLLMCHDRLDGDEIMLTHEFMAMMIGAQRSGVTVALHTLEGIGTIRLTRGMVTVSDRDKLEALAGDSYGVSEAEYRRLIGPLGPPSTTRDRGDRHK